VSGLLELHFDIAISAAGRICKLTSMRCLRKRIQDSVLMC
jgi:hypothetical protein